MRDLGDTGRRKLCEQIIELSGFISDQAVAHGWSYIDVGSDFADGVEEAIQVLGS